MIRKKAARKTDAYVSRETIDDSESDSGDGNRNDPRHRHDSDDGNRNDMRHRNDSDGDRNLSTANHRDPWAVTVAPHYPPPSSTSRKEDVSSPGNRPY